MSAVLRAYGADFDVDAFLVGCSLSVCAIKRRGEPVLPGSQTNGRRHDRSGVHVLVSDAGLHEFPRQVEEAAAYLRANAEEVRRLRDFPGVDGVTLDFGIARRDVAAQYDRLPADLILLAASCGLDIDLSQYPTENSSSK